MPSLTAPTTRTRKSSSNGFVMPTGRLPSRPLESQSARVGEPSRLYPAGLRTSVHTVVHLGLRQSLCLELRKFFLDVDRKCISVGLHHRLGTSNLTGSQPDLKENLFGNFHHYSRVIGKVEPEVSHIFCIKVMQPFDNKKK